MEVECNNISCYWNGGKFCKKKIIFMRNGVCGALVYTNGQRKPPEMWQHPHIDDDQQIENNIQTETENI